MTDGLIKGADGKTRCWWCGDDPEYMRYHDEEWGVPVTDDRTLFEKICLEGFQAGLSWITILRKRENFRAAFCNFEHDKIAAFTQDDVERLMQDAGIVRHRGKIESVINNAQRMEELLSEFKSLYTYSQHFQPQNRPKRFDYKALSAISKTPESIAMSKDLKSRGWSFVGPTTCYAFMQAMGMVNDHIEGCFRR